MKLARTLALLLVAAAAAVSLNARAELTPGKEYLPLSPPQETEAPGKIEVVEFFYYGCPHCYDLEPALNAWLAKKPGDVVFRRVPAIFRESWIPLTKTYYALEALGLLDKLHDKVFKAVHVDKLNLSDEKLMADWIAKQGADRQKWLDTYNSFGVQNRVKRARQLTVAYGIQGTPALVVNGKYLTSGALAGGHGKSMEVVDQLIAMARKEDGAK